MSLYHYWATHQTSIREFAVKRTPRLQSVNDTLNSAESNLIDLYRLDRQGILFMSDKIRNHSLVTRKTTAGLPSEAQVLVALRYFATGCSINSLKNTANLHLSHDAVEKCIKQVSTAISEVMLGEFINYQWDAGSIAAVKSGFGDYGGFPGCLGAIDCTKVKIRKPSIDEDAYVSRNPGHFINCQAICDHRLKFVDAVVKWPGSVNDAVIWDHCGFNEKLKTFFDRQSKEYQGWLLGDSGYAQRPNMMVPFLEPDTSGQESYNRSHKRSRCLIERSFGCLKSRFRCLCKNTSGAIMFEPEVACSINRSLSAA